MFSEFYLNLKKAHWDTILKGSILKQNVLGDMIQLKKEKIKYYIKYQRSAQHLDLERGLSKLAAVESKPCVLT